MRVTVLTPIYRKEISWFLRDKAYWSPNLFYICVKQFNSYEDEKKGIGFMGSDCDFKFFEIECSNQIG